MRGESEFYIRENTGMKKGWSRRLAAAILILACVVTGCNTAGKQEKNGETSAVEDLDTAGENTAETESNAETIINTDTEEKLSGETVKIGAIYALSGNNAVIGTNILRGLDFAAEEINRNGGIDGHPVEIVRGDTRGDAGVAQDVAKQLIVREGVQAVIGCHQSTLTEVVSRICEEYHVPMITAISTVDSISCNQYEYFFRMCPVSSVYLKDMFLYLQAQKEQTGKVVKTIAVFADNSLIGQESIRCARLYAPQFGMEIIEEVQYEQGTADLSEEIAQLKKADADAVVAESYAYDASLLMETMKEQDYEPPILIAKANGFADPSFLSEAGESAEGVATVVEWNPDMTKGHEVNQRFKKIFGIDMNGHSAEAYTAVWVLKTAMEQAESTNGEAVKDALKTLDIRENFPGGGEIILPYDRICFEDHEIEGTWHYHDNISASVAIAQIQNGEYKTVWPFEYAKEKIQYPARYSR